MSTSSASVPSISIRVSIESRVVPATGLTIVRSVPSSAFSSDDLPTFGRPRIAIRGNSSALVPSPASPAWAVMRSSRSPVPRPWVAETAIGSPSPSELSSAARWTSAGLSTLLATTTTGCDADRSSAATSASPGPSPAFASTTCRITSASAIASRAWCWTDRERESSAARSTPPVSIRVSGTPFHSVSISLRSLVTPASAWVTASRPPARRLISVLLPAFG